MHISFRGGTTCPYCGSDDVQMLEVSFAVLRCRECDAHFEEDEYDARPTPHRGGSRRRLRHTTHFEDD